MFDHVHLRVRDLAATTAFYEQALGPLGVKKDFDDGELVEFGSLSLSADGPPSEHVHLALPARSKHQVSAFHAAGTGAGGTDNGAPGIRDQYADDYYAAYVLDLDGNNIEAVFRLRNQ